MNTKRSKYAGIFGVVCINLCLFIGMGWFWRVYAYPTATFTVNTTADTHDLDPGNGVCADTNGACSLRAAIEEANTLAGADTIGLPAGTYLLSAGELWINDSLSLNGEAMATTVVDGQMMSRVFNIDNFEDTNGIDVSLWNMTIQNGQTTDVGGGIRTQENLSVYNSKIFHNQSTEGGGGMYAGVVGSILISNTQIIENTALYSSGGGIFNKALRLIAYNCMISNNFSTTKGGGISTLTNMTLINSVIESNQANASGGGIHNSGILIITNSVIQSNTMTDDISPEYGGGIINANVLTITNSIVQNNVSWGDGGGIGNWENGHAFIHATTIRDNMAHKDGGGIYNEMSSSVHIENSEISGNQSEDGGGVYNDRSTMTINSSHIYSNTADTGAGAGIFTIDLEPPLESSNYILITSSLIESNTTTDGPYPNGGGGIYIESGAITIIYSTIRKNTSNGGGGGIDSLAGKVSLLNSTVSENFSTGSGGGILGGGYFLNVVNSTISGNLAGGGGGGIYVSDDVTVILNHSTIAGNNGNVDGSSYGDGGGIYFGASGYMVLFKNTLLANNTAAHAPDCGGAGGNTLYSLDFNLIENPLDCPITGETSHNILWQDPNLGSLANNGGNTFTHALFPGSPAIDTGSCMDTNGNSITIDQRGLARPFGENCDIGAYETYGTEPTPVPTLTPTPTCVPRPTSTPGVTPTPFGTPSFLPVIAKGSGC